MNRVINWAFLVGDKKVKMRIFRHISEVIIV